MITVAPDEIELGEEIFNKTQESPDEKLERISDEIESKKKQLTILYPSLIIHFSSPIFKKLATDNEALKDLLVELKDYLGSEIQNTIEKELESINGVLVNGLLIPSTEAQIKIEAIRASAENVIQELMKMKSEGYPDSEGAYDHNPGLRDRSMPDYFKDKGISIVKHTNNSKTPHKIEDLYNLVELVGLMILQVELLAEKSAQKNTSVKLRRRINTQASNIQA